MAVLAIGPAVDLEAPGHDLGCPEWLPALELLDGTAAAPTVFFGKGLRQLIAVFAELTNEKPLPYKSN